jgi:ABC-2 type transport system permease protein
LLRLPVALSLVFVYLIFTYTLTFCLVTFAFRLTKISSLTFTKNLFIWLASGELFPMDLLPPTLQKLTSYLPFSCACYVPVGYLTHRLELDAVVKGLLVTSGWALILGFIAKILWHRGLRAYSGTGA